MKTLAVSIESTEKETNACTENTVIANVAEPAEKTDLNGLKKAIICFKYGHPNHVQQIATILGKYVITVENWVVM